MANDVQFVNGMVVKAPHEKAPDFVKAQISIKVADLGMWLREKHKAGQEWVNLDIKVAKTGKWYAAVNDYKKGDAKPQAEKPAEKSGSDDDIPF